ncbi:anti-repressor SinI family protein [Salicibibacter cibi]|nr:anti-repressor SinI family protein [Salicibibacter cibi]
MHDNLYFVDRGMQQEKLLIRQKASHYNVDPEWMELMKEARNMGLSKEQIRRFIKEAAMSKNT